MALFTQILPAFRIFHRRQFVLTSRMFISNETKENIDKMVHKSKVVIFMKGTPEAPLCGFSNAVSQILRMHGVKYDSYNVLESEDLRKGVKEYSNWATIPQVFINGEFVGGCDILLKMHQNGELIEELKKVGIESVLLKEASGPKDT